jgi:hypothetical protein
MLTGEQTLRADMVVVVKGRREMFQQFVERVICWNLLRILNVLRLHIEVGLNFPDIRSSHQLTLGALTYLPQIKIRADISSFFFLIIFFKWATVFPFPTGKGAV